jgi:hypothetical protein
MIVIQKTTLNPDLKKRAAEIRKAAEISGKIGFYKDIAQYTDWMPLEYKENLIEILKWVEENG